MCTRVTDAYWNLQIFCSQNVLFWLHLACTCIMVSTVTHTIPLRMCELHYILLSSSLLFCLAARFYQKWRDDKHEQKWIKGTSYSVFLAMHHAWPTEFCEVWFSPTDMNNFPSDNGRTGRRSEGESTKPTCNCQLFPEEPSFYSLSGQWELLIISVRTITRNSGSAEIIKSQSIKITTPQRGEHVKSNHQSLDSDSEPKYQLCNWKQLKHQ